MNFPLDNKPRLPPASLDADAEGGRASKELAATS